MEKEANKKTKKSVGNTKKTTNAKKTTNKSTKLTKKNNNTSTKGKEVMKRIETSPANESKKMLLIVVALLVALGIFYLIAGLATGNIKLNKKENVEIQYSEILAGSTFKQTDSEYVVLYYDYTSDNATDYTSLVSTYTEKDDHLTIYTVDLSKKFNTSYIREDGDTKNENPTSAKELKIANPTLIVIKDKTVTKYIESYDDIKNYME